MQAALPPQTSPRPLDRGLSRRAPWLAEAGHPTSRARRLALEPLARSAAGDAQTPSGLLASTSCSTPVSMSSSARALRRGRDDSHLSLAPALQPTTPRRRAACLDVLLLLPCLRAPVILRSEVGGPCLGSLRRRLGADRSLIRRGFPSGAFVAALSAARRTERLQQSSIEPRVERRTSWRSSASSKSRRLSCAHRGRAGGRAR